MSQSAEKLSPAARTRESVAEYYGRMLKTTRDLKTSTCCAAEAMPAYLAETARLLHPEVTERFYGCGVPIPPALQGLTVLDLGCGSGRDCYLLSKLVGETGRVIGVDMTEPQLAVARRHREFHARAFGYGQSNVEFHHGYIEDLKAAGVADDSVDLVVSNCVINLSPDKAAVFNEIFRVLKPGGELYFSDVYADRRVPEPLREDPVLLGECLSGALYTEDLRRILARTGCADARTVSQNPIALNDPEIQRKVGMIGFESRTIRAFKLGLEDRCEDYGQVAYYRGGLPESPLRFVLDDHHVMEKDRPLPVCGNSADMLTKTRYAKYFQVVGEKAMHFGPFDGGVDRIDARDASGGSCC